MNAFTSECLHVFDKLWRPRLTRYRGAGVSALGRLAGVPDHERDHRTSGEQFDETDGAAKNVQNDSEEHAGFNAGQAGDIPSHPPLERIGTGAAGPGVCQIREESPRTKGQEEIGERDDRDDELHRGVRRAADTGLDSDHDKDHQDAGGDKAVLQGAHDTVRCGQSISPLLAFCTRDGANPVTPYSLSLGLNTLDSMACREGVAANISNH